MNDQRKQEIIDKWFGGSVERYEQETAELRARVVEESFAGDKASAAADQEAGRHETIYWQDIVNDANILPHLAQDIRSLIFKRLGYLPSDATLLEQEPFLRALLQQHRGGLLQEPEFTAQVDTHLRGLRNLDLQRNGWVATLGLTSEDYARYETELFVYKQRARDRVVGFLGYEPDLCCSLEAEMRLRRVMSYDDFQLSETVTEVDIQLLTIILYRELYLEDGPEEADGMPLLGGDATVAASVTAS